MDNLQDIFDAFDWMDIPTPLFYRCDIALRFELGGGHSAQPARFMQSMDRARRIASAAFAGASNLTALIPHGTSLDRSAVAEIGFSAPFFALGERKVSQSNSGVSEIEWVADFPNREDQITALLWNSVAKEMGVTPCVPCLGNIYIIDRARSVILHVYDDRGMDIAAAHPSAILPLYKTFNSWLLDYDRQKMDFVFGKEN